MHEAFCFWAYSDYERAARDAGFELAPGSRGFTNPWLVEHRFAPVATLRPASATPRCRGRTRTCGCRPAASGVRSAAPVAACAALAALSLLLPWALAFDPQVWVAWGHDAFHGHLDTRGGPTWKP